MLRKGSFYLNCLFLVGVIRNNILHIVLQTLYTFEDLWINLSVSFSEISYGQVS